MRVVVLRGVWKAEQDGAGLSEKQVPDAVPLKGIADFLPDGIQMRPHPNTPGERALRQLVEAITPAPLPSPNALVIDAVATPAAKPLPPRQPLPTPVLYPRAHPQLDGTDSPVAAVIQARHLGRWV